MATLFINAEDMEVAALNYKIVGNKLFQRLKIQYYTQLYFVIRIVTGWGRQLKYRAVS